MFNVYGADKVIATVHPIHLMNTEQQQVAANPQTKSTELGCKSTRRLHTHHHLSLSFPSRVCVPPSRTSAEACFNAGPMRSPRGAMCSVARLPSLSWGVCVCCATLHFSGPSSSNRLISGPRER